MITFSNVEMFNIAVDAIIKSLESYNQVGPIFLFSIKSWILELNKYAFKFELNLY